MKVTLKVKHLVMGVAAIGILLSLLQFVVIPKLQVSTAVKDYEAGNVGGKKSLLAALENAASPSKKWELIREYMIGYGSDSPAHSFDVYVGSGSIMSHSTERESRIWSWEEKLPYLRQYLDEGPDDIYRISAANQLVQYFVSDDRTDEALAILEETESRSGRSTSDKLKFERAKLLSNAGESGEAMRLISELEAKRPSVDLDFDGKVAQLKAQLLVGEGRADFALKEIDRELDETRKWMADEKKKFPEMDEFTPVKLEQLTSFREQLVRALNDNAQTETATVSGTVKRSDGTAMARVGVFLRAEQDVSHSVTDGEPYQMITDSHGRYEFKNVIPGNYQLYIGLLYDQIDGWTWPTMVDDWIAVGNGHSVAQDVTLRPLIEIQEPANDATLTGRTVKFRWKPVEGAAYYALYGKAPLESGVSNLRLQDRIADASADVPVETLYQASGGFSLREVDGKMVVTAKDLLGLANPNNRYSWYVEAYDANDRMITRSDGYRLNENTMGALPFFYLKERTLTAADEFMINEQLDLALSAYKKDFAADRSDRHSLHMIIRILGAQASMAREYELSEEAISYLEKMQELNPGSRDILFQLFDVYESRRNWAKADEYYHRYLIANGGKPEGYTQSRYASALMMQRRFADAAEQFREAMESDRSHRFIGNYLAVELYVAGSIETAARLAEEYPEWAPLERGVPNWSGLVMTLERESRLDERGYIEELRRVLEYFFDGEQAQLDKWSSSTDKKGIKAFIDALLKVD
ncbi:carboxypeptidase regulatory-like domain-containing protein [Cohnella herbarum]|uniref:Carboxypeptidase regulatory-like domain-containing protein n=1 Tax=Cohnella herbarum TaxID=2728023 RepID=A0A7Z2VPZ2_9BACL|nr:carboxypeptidase regulatory-like domain-containing protein [Cohnella herbarum]QJD87002.1 carboxypeptidase regulatory-like domain-containing protein [Cohnella herbarum]